jgi:hypothetical protein
MATAHSEALKKAVIALKERPEQLIVFRRFQKGLSNGGFDQDWRDVIYQSPQSRRDALETAAAFAAIWTGIQLGTVAHLRIKLGTFPLFDHFLSENAAALQKLPPPFCSKVWGNNSEQDGIIEWRAPICLASTPHAHPLRTQEIQPGSAPIEIGSTAASKTLSHLNRCGRVARWPYGHDSITLMALVGCDNLGIALPLQSVP